MTKQLLIIDYSDESDNNLSEFASAVHAALNGNANFTWTIDRLTGFKAKIDLFITKLIAARSNDSLKIAEKNESREDVLDELHDLAIDTNKQANGNMAKLISSGFILVKQRGTVGILPPPNDFKVVNGKNPGELLCTVKANQNADMYLFYFAPVPAPANVDDWKLKVSKKHSKLFKGFKSGEQVAVKCAYQGTAEDLNYSHTITIYVQ